MRRSLILVAALFLVACDGGIFVRGVVRDPAGNPMSGVRVFLERMDERRFEGKTDAAGCFHLGGTAAPGRYDFNFVIEADGFVSAFAGVPTLEETLLEVQLEPSGSATKSSIRKISSSSSIPCP